MKRGLHKTPRKLHKLRKCFFRNFPHNPHRINCKVLKLQKQYFSYVRPHFQFHFRCFKVPRVIHFDRFSFFIYCFSFFIYCFFIFHVASKTCLRFYLNLDMSSIEKKNSCQECNSIQGSPDLQLDALLSELAGLLMSKDDQMQKQFYRRFLKMNVFRAQCVPAVI